MPRSISILLDKVARLTNLAYRSLFFISQVLVLIPPPFQRARSAQTGVFFALMRERKTPPRLRSGHKRVSTRLQAKDGSEGRTYARSGIGQQAFRPAWQYNGQGMGPKTQPGASWCLQTRFTTWLPTVTATRPARLWQASYARARARAYGRSLTRASTPQSSTASNEHDVQISDEVKSNSPSSDRVKIDSFSR